MKKKTKIILVSVTVIFIALIVCILLFLCGDSCGKEKPSHYELPTATLGDQIATSEEPMTLADAAEILAPLTNEDGTGEINLNMTWQEIAAVLDKKGVPYRVSGNWTEEEKIYGTPDTRSIFVDYSIHYDPLYNEFTVAMTKKGLKMNDSVTRAVELYGEPDKIVIDSAYDNAKDYYYNMGKLYCEATGSDRTVILHLSIGDETVVTIQIKFLDQTNYLGENLEETFWD